MCLPGCILNTPVNFIIDSGAELSVLPRCFVPQSLCFPTDIRLAGVDGSLIKCYGHFNATVSVTSLRRDYKVNFIITDTQPILGADFLTYYDLSSNMKSKTLCDSYTTLSTTLICKKAQHLQIRI